MSSFISALLAALASVCRTCAALHWEILALRHQLGVLQHSSRTRPRLTPGDKILWAWLSRIWADWPTALVIVKPETVAAWHRKGFRLFWTWKSRRRAGRPTVPPDVRTLIRTMSKANPLWGAPRFTRTAEAGHRHRGDRLSKYMVRRQKPPSQTWRTFLENHLKDLVSVDFFTVPRIRFQVLYLFLVLAHGRRRIVHFNVTAHPTAEWTARQLRDAFPRSNVPRYLLPRS